MFLKQGIAAFIAILQKLNCYCSVCEGVIQWKSRLFDIGISIQKQTWTFKEKLLPCMWSNLKRLRNMRIKSQPSAKRKDKS